MPFGLDIPDVDSVKTDLAFNYPDEIRQIQKETGLESLWDAVKGGSVASAAFKGIFTKEGRADADMAFTDLSNIGVLKSYIAEDEEYLEMFGQRQYTDEQYAEAEQFFEYYPNNSTNRYHDTQEQAGLRHQYTNVLNEKYDLESVNDSIIGNKARLAESFGRLRNLEKKYDVLEDEHEERIFEFGDRMDANTAMNFRDKYYDFLNRFGLMKDG
ncbi:MAG: hypothetical protein HN932_13000 [Candidatus Marinimicrobia bacterium]|jgi:hypothetical protein|nr:hypothetical protein [Candidatus Neomarinimicrobiota bacterium]MBT7339071.1 hypothetical protein [Candidatus Jacksonbacteria bacterium]